ncbi:hypothetical protein ACUXST_000649 [Sphingomonas sp. F9_3S_D5_B_2]
MSMGRVRLGLASMWILTIAMFAYLFLIAAY